MNGSEYRSFSWLPQEVDGARGELHPSIADREQFSGLGTSWLTAKATPLRVRPEDDGEADEEDWDDDWDD